MCKTSFSIFLTPRIREASPLLNHKASQSQETEDFPAIPPIDEDPVTPRTVPASTGAGDRLSNSNKPRKQGPTVRTRTISKLTYRSKSRFRSKPRFRSRNNPCPYDTTPFPRLDLMIRQPKSKAKPPPPKTIPRKLSFFERLASSNKPVRMPTVSTPPCTVESVLPTVAGTVNDQVQAESSGIVAVESNTIGMSEQTVGCDNEQIVNELMQVSSQFQHFPNNRSIMRS